MTSIILLIAKVEIRITDKATPRYVVFGFKYKPDLLADSLLNKNFLVFQEITKQSKITELSLKFRV